MTSKKILFLKNRFKEITFTILLVFTNKALTSENDISDLNIKSIYTVICSSNFSIASDLIQSLNSIQYYKGLNSTEQQDLLHNYIVRQVLSDNSCKKQNILFLTRNISNINYRYKYNETLLHLLLQNHLTNESDIDQAINELIDRGANVNTVSDHGATVLIQAMRSLFPNKQIIQKIAKLTKNISAIDTLRNSAFEYATTMHKSYDLMKIILDLGPYPETANSSRFPVEHVMATVGARNTQLMIEYGLRYKHLDEDLLIEHFVIHITHNQLQAKRLLQSFEEIQERGKIRILSTALCKSSLGQKIEANKKIKNEDIYQYLRKNIKNEVFVLKFILKMKLDFFSATDTSEVLEDLHKIENYYKKTILKNTILENNYVLNQSILDLVDKISSLNDISYEATLRYLTVLWYSSGKDSRLYGMIFSYLDRHQENKISHIRFANMLKHSITSQVQYWGDLANQTVFTKGVLSRENRFIPFPSDFDIPPPSDLATEFMTEVRTKAQSVLINAYAKNCMK